MPAVNPRAKESMPKPTSQKRQSKWIIVWILGVVSFLSMCLAERHDKLLCTTVLFYGVASKTNSRDMHQMVRKANFGAACLSGSGTRFRGIFIGSRIGSTRRIIPCFASGVTVLPVSYTPISFLSRVQTNRVGIMWLSDICWVVSWRR